MPHPERPLYAMAKPPPDILAQLSALPRRSRERPSDLLHVTLLAFVDLADWPPEFMPLLGEILSGFEADAFDIMFDRIVERRAVTLRSSRPLKPARAFQRQLMDFLKSQGFRWFGAAPVPHLTVNYHGDGLGDEPTAPIAWRVEEVLLIESFYGKARHEVRGRLRLRQPML